MFVGRFQFIAMATMLNMVTALVTDADNPAIMAKLQSRRSMHSILMGLPCLRRSKGFNKTFSRSNIIPT